MHQRSINDTLNLIECTERRELNSNRRIEFNSNLISLINTRGFQEFFFFRKQKRLANEVQIMFM